MADHNDFELDNYTARDGPMSDLDEEDFEFTES